MQLVHPPFGSKGSGGHDGGGRGLSLAQPPSRTRGALWVAGGGTHRPSPPGWGRRWPRRPRADPPPGDSAGHPCGCSGTCSAGQRSSPRRRTGPEGCSGGQGQSAPALAQPLRPLRTPEGAARPGTRLGPSPHLPRLRHPPRRDVATRPLLAPTRFSSRHRHRPGPAPGHYHTPWQPPQ